MLKVFILTEGGRDIGIGHITRCISLCQAFEERGIRPELMVNGDDITEDLLSGRKYKIFNWLEQVERLFKAIKGASIVIIDSYLANEGFYRRISERLRLAIYIDDNKRIDYPKGFVVNGSTYANELDYPNNDSITYLLGSQYIPLRKEFWGSDKKKIKDKITDIMVTFGGDDSKGLTVKILDFLNRDYPNYIKNVVIGNAFQNRSIKKIESLKDKKTNIFYGPEASELKAIMLNSDIAISAGGQTLYELARTGVPTVGICVADNQERNLKEWQKRGFIEYVGWYDNRNLRMELRKSIEHLKNIDIRKNKSSTGKRFVDGQGSLRLVKIILGEFFKNRLTLRKANFNDALDILKLANDDSVRQNSFNPKRIERDEHLKWLTEKLNDNNCIFFIINMRDMFCGQVRFDINSVKKEAIVNISLKEDIRSLGLGSFLLDKSIYEFSRIRRDIRSIKAYIKETNIFSIKAFERANFKFPEDTIIKGNKAKVYIRELDYVGV